jgi:hypothetical protein
MDLFQGQQDGSPTQTPTPSPGLLLGLGCAGTKQKCERDVHHRICYAKHCREEWKIKLDDTRQIGTSSQRLSVRFDGHLLFSGVSALSHSRCTILPELMHVLRLEAFRVLLTFAQDSVSLTCTVCCITVANDRWERFFRLDTSRAFRMLCEQSRETADEGNN